MSIYTRFTPDDIVEANPTTVTTGLWSGDTGSFEGADGYVNSTQLANSGIYYVDVYDRPLSDELSEVQFAIAYGHVNGGGAPTLENDQQAKLPTKAIYSQYRNLLLDPSDTKFTFQGVESDHIYVINLQRSRIREQLDPGNWSLPLSGANGYFTFIDDSGQTLGALTANSKAGRVFNIVSGSITTTSGSVTSSANAKTWGGTTGPGYGLVYPDLGIIVLNPDAICPAVGFYVSGTYDTTGVGGVTGSALSVAQSLTGPIYTSANYTNLWSQAYAPATSSVTAWGTKTSAYNHLGLLYSIKWAVSSSVFEFRARSAETISSTHYFVRLRNKEYNYSNNPTFYNPDNGALNIADFKNDPRVYVTTVGLYNDNNELLAVAKLSAPLRKSFDEEVLLRVRLDF